MLAPGKVNVCVLGKQNGCVRVSKENGCVRIGVLGSGVLGSATSVLR